MIKRLKWYGIWFSIWFAVAFFFGLCSTLGERGDFKNPKSGCIYESWAPYLSPGYIVACELFRKRFEREGLGR